MKVKKYNLIVMASKLKNIIYFMKITHTRSKINTITKLDSKRRKGGRR